MKLLKLYLVFLSFSAFSFGAQNKESVHFDDAPIWQQSISEDDLESYKSNSEFDYTEKAVEEGWLDKLVVWLQNILRKFWEAIFGVGTATGFLYFMFKIFPYLLLAILLFLLLRFFLKVNANALITHANAQGTVNLSEEEYIIKNEDIPALIKQAVSEQNFRLAIRYYYLLTLKLLTANELIKWKPQKTNEDYINEFTSADLKNNFKNLTKIYDYVWYGEFSVDATKYEHLKVPFESLNNSMSK